MRAAVGKTGDRIRVLCYLSVGVVIVAGLVLDVEVGSKSFSDGNIAECIDVRDKLLKE